MGVKYPLEQLASIKQKRLEVAERELAEKKKQLAFEEDKLEIFSKKRDQVKEHYQSKLDQLRDELDHNAVVYKIEQMKQYLKKVMEELQIEERKVVDQKKVVVDAEKKVEIARKNLFKRHKDVEKIKLHRKDWEIQMAKSIEREEEAENDELSSSRYIAKRKEYSDS